MASPSLPNKVHRYYVTVYLAFCSCLLKPGSKQHGRAAMKFVVRFAPPQLFKPLKPRVKKKVAQQCRNQNLGADDALQ